MLAAVGYTDLGRTSTDTGHSYKGTKEDAVGIAARYYMNGNFYGADPDAFTVSEQLITDQSWHTRKAPLSLNEAEVSISLAAIAGGMFEIGDDLPALGAQPERLKLLQNKDLLDMVRLGRAAKPIDLMTYRDEDEQPGVFFLREDERQAMLIVFNWTESTRSHKFNLAELGFVAKGDATATDVLHRGGSGMSKTAHWRLPIRLHARLALSSWSIAVFQPRAHSSTSRWQGTQTSDRVRSFRPLSILPECRQQAITGTLATAPQRTECRSSSMHTLARATSECS